MRHNKKINHLSRKSAHRKSMFSNMATSLIMHKRIFTTTAKAKALRKEVEPIITLSKVDTTASRRQAFQFLQDKRAVAELFQVISQKVADRPGGYTRIIKTGYRLGDNAQMCFIELVDFNESMLKTKVDKKARTRRSSRKKSETAIQAEPAVEIQAEAQAELLSESESSPKTAKETSGEEPKAQAQTKAKKQEPKAEKQEAAKQQAEVAEADAPVEAEPADAKPVDQEAADEASSESK